MLKSFFLTKKYGPYAWIMLAILLAISWYLVQILVVYNVWNRDMMDALKDKEMELFWTLFVGWDVDRIWSLANLSKNPNSSFLEIVALFTPIAVISGWLTMRYTFKWREANTLYYLARWEKCEVKIEGASQRLQEDLMLFGKILTTLIEGVFTKIFVLFAFIPVLWYISDGLEIWNGQVIPGFLVWGALGLSIGGTCFTVLLGWIPTKLEVLNQVVEAILRKQLVLAEDDFSMRAFKALARMFDDVRKNYYRLFNWYTGLSVWQRLFGFVMGNIALVLLAPSYFAGAISFGVLMQANQAFGQIERAMTFFVDRYTQIIEFVSVIKRLREFDNALPNEVTP